MYIPITLAVRLNGLGQLESTDQGQIAFMSFTRPNEDGHFGVVDENTHTVYETQPCPYVSTRRILREIAQYNDPADHEFMWDIDALTPVVEEGHHPAGFPTRNLIGYEQLKPL